MMRRREFLQLTVLGTAAMGMGQWAWSAPVPRGKLVSPGCRRSKVKIARLYLAGQGLWPHPELDPQVERQSYERAFAEMANDFADVHFLVDELITSPEQISALADRLAQADGILAIHIRMGIGAMLSEIYKTGRPTMIFAAPYSGHEWSQFGSVLRQPEPPLVDFILSADKRDLAAAVRPIRALHHLREAKILNVTLRQPGEFHQAVKDKFGTEIKHIGLEPVVVAYEKVSERDAEAEAKRWIDGAKQIVEPTRAEIVRSCRLALAFERLLDEEEATVLTVDCYGTMWDRTIKLPAYPCLGFSRLNSMGFGGICESDLRCAITHIIFQGLAGKPGFISDPTVDQSTNTIILAHCMGTIRMDGPDSSPLPYKLRNVMERQEGVVPQVFMPVGKRVTQALFADPNTLLYFTGEIVDAPDVERGCRTKITVRVDGDVEKLWRNWSAGLHRSTCLGDLTKDLERFARLARMKLVNEVA
jgi:hypothetical protein